MQFTDCFLWGMYLLELVFFSEVQELQRDVKLGADEDGKGSDLVCDDAEPYKSELLTGKDRFFICIHT